MRRPAILLGSLAAALALFGAVVASASAAPTWDLRTTWADSHLPPGGTGLFKVQLRNIGDSASTGPVTVTNQLPPGVTRIAPLAPFPETFPVFPPGTGLDGLLQRDELSSSEWECSGSSLVSCEHSAPIDTRGDTFVEHGFAQQIIFRVKVAPGAAGTFTNTTTASGGGGQSATLQKQVTIDSHPAGFGIDPETLLGDAFEGEYPQQGRERQAGAHPRELRVDFDFNLKQGERPVSTEFPAFPGVCENNSEFLSPCDQIISPLVWQAPDDFVKTVDTVLPRGMIGNPEATPKCSPSDFLGDGAIYMLSTACPPDTQVGVIDLDLQDGEEKNGVPPVGVAKEGIPSRIPVYNLEPPPGVPADFGFRIAFTHTHIYPTLDPANGYSIKAEVPYITTINGLRSARFTMWGVPADPSHDHLRARVRPGPNGEEFGASSSAPIRPLLTMPMECGVDRSMHAGFESWQKPGQFVGYDLPSFQVSGCGDERFRFRPNVGLQPTSRAAGGPTGLRVNLEVPQRNEVVANAQQLYAGNDDIAGIPTAPLKKAVVTLPEGMTISTSAAQGLGSCTLEQIGLGTNDPVTCPESSQYGTLTLHTPILPKDAPMSGRIYIAKQNDNPFHNFLSLYLVIQDPQRGLLVKIPGKVDLDPTTGQITTSFDNLPQFPVSDMEMNLKGGVRAALVNPSTCGTKTITATFYPWNAPNDPVTKTSSYDITQKADGSPCVNSLGDRPFGPSMEAGTVNPAAGAYSPFAFRLQRSDDDQEFSQLGVTMPKGLLAKIAGLSKCSEAAIAAAAAPGRSGSEEAANPSCPESSQIGSTDVGSGVGQVLTYVPGKAYLAGPYQGAPLSMVVITPVLAGPYDLGVIAVRSAIHVNPVSTEVKVQTDPFPQIFKGIPVRIRDIRVKIDRPQTTLNPTNCTPMQVGARLTGTGGDLVSTADDSVAELSSRFQAADCASLPFKPNLRFRLKGGTHRGDYPAFTATLRARPGDANIARTAVTLPHSEFLAQEHIRTVCTRVQYAADQCPAGSVYGHARATSPLFDGALEGPVYLRSSSNRLPDLVARLDGEISVELSGRIDSVKKGIRNTFDVVPDAPVSTFTLRMQGGKKGLLVNSRNLCKGVNRANVVMLAQNGKRLNTKPAVANSCKKRKAGKRKRAGSHRRSAKPRH